MASAAEQLAANLSFKSFAKAEELKKRLWFTLFALLVYRLGTYIPLPGINIEEFQKIFAAAQTGIAGQFNMFSGGAVGRMAIFALNVMPYITASIIIQLLGFSSPTIQALKKDGEQGRKQINQYTRYATVVLAAVQGFGMAVALESAPNVVINPGWFFKISAVITLVGGTMFLMWLGEQITARGVGNGVSLIIFAGIVAELPIAMVQTLNLAEQGSIATPLLLGLIIMMLAVVAFIVFVERAQRRLLVQYPKQQVNQSRATGGERSHLPLKVNAAGVMPPIFASSLLMMPATMSQFNAGSEGGLIGDITTLLGRGQPLYLAVYTFMIVFFCYFWVANVNKPEETADNLKKSGGYIQGIRPGEQTANFIEKIVGRLTTIGAAYMVLVCILPELLISNFSVPFYFGGTALLIAVTVTMDTVAQIQSHLLAHQYESLIKKSKIRGRGRRR